MSQFGFSTETNGYSIEEVDRYVTRLKQEYRNAVEWSNEIEKKAEESKKDSLSAQQADELRNENEKLRADCRLLAAKLRELIQQNDNPEKAKQEADSILLGARRDAAAIITDAERNAEAITAAARRDADSVVADAHRDTAAVVSEAETKALFIVTDAEQRASEILRKSETECQGILTDATQKIEELKNELQVLYSQKSTVSEELSSLFAARADLSARIEQARNILEGRK